MGYNVIRVGSTTFCFLAGELLQKVSVRDFFSFAIKACKTLAQAALYYMRAFTQTMPSELVPRIQLNSIFHYLKTLICSLFLFRTLHYLVTSTTNVCTAYTTVIMELTMIVEVIVIMEVMVIMMKSMGIVMVVVMMVWSRDPDRQPSIVFALVVGVVNNPPC